MRCGRLWFVYQQSPVPHWEHHRRTSLRLTKYQCLMRRSYGVDLWPRPRRCGLWHRRIRQSQKPGVLRYCHGLVGQIQLESARFQIDSRRIGRSSNYDRRRFRGSWRIINHLFVFHSSRRYRRTYRFSLECDFGSELFRWTPSARLQRWSKFWYSPLHHPMYGKKRQAGQVMFDILTETRSRGCHRYRPSWRIPCLRRTIC